MRCCGSEACGGGEGGEEEEEEEEEKGRNGGWGGHGFDSFVDFFDFFFWERIENGIGDEEFSYSMRRDSLSCEVGFFLFTWVGVKLGRRNAMRCSWRHRRYMLSVRLIRRPEASVGMGGPKVWRQ